MKDTIGGVVVSSCTQRGQRVHWYDSVVGITLTYSHLPFSNNFDSSESYTCNQCKDHHVGYCR